MEAPKTIEIPVSEILIEDRQRKDLGDIDSLAESILRHGIIQPIVINHDKRLIAGERRLTAAKKLGLTYVPVVYKETLTEADLTEMELEENVRRKDMSWKERCTSIAKIHYIRQNRALKEGDDWTYRMTGEMMGLSQASVGYTLQISKELAKPDSGIHQCEGFTDAIKWMLQQREDEARAELARRTKLGMTAAAERTSPESVEMVAEEPTERKKPGENTLPLSRMLIHGDCLQVLHGMQAESIDHCISDPPYGIDMANLQQEGSGMDVSRVADTHDVRENEQLLAAAIPQIARVIRPNGYVALWCDIMQWQLIYDAMVNCGLRVQRWPIIWHKTHQCMNQAAQYNTTKNFEMCILARKERGTLAQKTDTSIVAASRADTVSNPFAKPWPVWEFLVKALTHPGQSILDPFCGEGSSLDVFARSWRVFIGIEIDEKHYNAALTRMRSTLDQLYNKPTYV